MEIIKSTHFFREVEHEIAKEVLEEAASGGKTDCYQSYIALINNKPAGWVCFGQTPCTLGTFDIYWLAVDADMQGRGIGSQLLNFAHEKIASQQGRLIVIETSGSQLYKPTQGFYKSNGYTLEATVRNFYAPQDDKLIFIKSLS